MNKFIRTLGAVFSCAAVISCTALTVSAEDAELAFEAQLSNGQWGQSVIYKTALQTAEAEFNPTSMTEDSVVKVEYECENPGSSCPVELIWQSWGEHENDKIVDWAKINPAEEGDGWADFVYSDIVAAYGTDDFSEVYNICVGDTGTPVTVTKITITNIGEPTVLPAWAAQAEEETEAETAEETTEETAAAEEEPEAETTVTEAETEAKTEKTTAETTAKETVASEAEAVSAPVEESGADAAGIILIVAIVIVAAAIVILMFLINQRGGFKK